MPSLKKENVDPTARNCKPKSRESQLCDWNGSMYTLALAFSGALHLPHGDLKSRKFDLVGNLAQSIYMVWLGR